MKLLTTAAIIALLGINAIHGAKTKDDNCHLPQYKINLNTLIPKIRPIFTE